ncbi:hypothetical protein RJT34_20309 [Clitoria ternatea]|uniref:Uncharacterized protein n=1 Tax=Clitoria ternatea TaxID=43366 RepID=A0AAN9ISL6_CLITE
MPEPRDRRPSSLDVATIFARRRASLIFHDHVLPLRSPHTPRTTRTTRPRFFHPTGPENTPLGTPRRARSRASSRSVLPSWYPRAPLRDITAVARAFERRRRGRVEEEEQDEEIVDQALLDPSSSVSISPRSVGVKLRTPAGSKVPKIFLDFSDLPEVESESSEPLVTPQKKLLNSIDTVEKVVREELQRLKRTPSAKKAEREKRVKTLMSMRRMSPNAPSLPIHLQLHSSDDLLAVASRASLSEAHGETNAYNSTRKTVKIN